MSGKHVDGLVLQQAQVAEPNTLLRIGSFTLEFGLPGELPGSDNHDHQFDVFWKSCGEYENAAATDKVTCGAVWKYVMGSWGAEYTLCEGVKQHVITIM